MPSSSSLVSRPRPSLSSQPPARRPSPHRHRSRAERQLCKEDIGTSDRRVVMSAGRRRVLGRMSGKSELTFTFSLRGRCRWAVLVDPSRFLLCELGLEPCVLCALSFLCDPQLVGLVPLEPVLVRLCRRRRACLTVVEDLETAPDLLNVILVFFCVVDGCPGWVISRAGPLQWRRRWSRASAGDRLRLDLDRLPLARRRGGRIFRFWR